MHTGETDVIVILLSNFHHIKAVNAAAESCKNNQNDFPGHNRHKLGHDYMQSHGSLPCIHWTPHLLLSVRASDPAASWCTKCYSSWWNLQPWLTLHSKLHQEWKKWWQNVSVGCIPVTQMKRLMLIFSEWDYCQRSRGMWREFPKGVMLWINISKGVSSKQATGWQQWQWYVLCKYIIWTFLMN